MRSVFASATSLITPRVFAYPRALTTPSNSWRLMSKSSPVQRLRSTSMGIGVCVPGVASSAPPARRVPAPAERRRSRFGWAIVLQLATPPMFDDVADLVGIVSQHEQRDVVRRNHSRLKQPGADPLLQSAPVRRHSKHDREVPYFLGLYERQRLEELIERSEAARKHDERRRIADEHQL